MVRHLQALLALPEDVAVAEATEADQPALRRLMQLYLYDFSDFVNMSLNADGTFENPQFIEDEFGPDFSTFVIRVKGSLAGFAIVSDRSYLTGAEGVYDMLQFFVMRAHRRKGVGEAAASTLFSMFPGPWEVRVLEENVAARPFWRSIIDRFSGGEYTESHVDNDRHRGTVYRFESRAS